MTIFGILSVIAMILCLASGGTAIMYFLIAEKSDVSFRLKRRCAMWRRMHADEAAYSAELWNRLIRKEEELTMLKAQIKQPTHGLGADINGKE
jgi:hypothetical protein